MIIFLENGESLSPFDIRDAAARLSLTPEIVRTDFPDGEERYARALGARLRSLDEILDTGAVCGSLILTERPIGIIAALRLSLPAYFYTGSRDSCELCPLVCPREQLGRALIPYSRGRGDSITLPTVLPYEFNEIRKKLRADLCAKLFEILN